MEIALKEIIFSLLLTVFQGDIDRELFETSGVVTPQGRIVLAFLTAGAISGNQLYAAVQNQAGDNIKSSNFQIQSLYSGQIFAISPKMVHVGNYVYLSAVCDGFTACIFRFNLNTNTWEAPVLLPTAAGLVVSTALVLFGNNLGLTMLTSDNRLLFLQANPLVATLALLNFVAVHSILNVGSTFQGATIARTAVDPATLRTCHIYRQLVTAVLLGNIVATCFLNNIATTTVLETLSTAVGSANYIEADSLFYNGVFYFMYFLASGAVKLAAFGDPALGAQILQLGVVSLLSGFPSMAMVVAAGSNPRLFAYWPGAAVVITLATLQFQQLNGFPINKVGPILALLLLSATLSIGIWGSGSVVSTIMTEAAPSGVPLLGSLGFGLLIILFIIIGLSRKYRLRQSDT